MSSVRLATTCRTSGTSLALYRALRSRIGGSPGARPASSECDLCLSLSSCPSRAVDHQRLIGPREHASRRSSPRRPRLDASRGKSCWRSPRANRAPSSPATLRLTPERARTAETETERGTETEARLAPRVHAPLHKIRPSSGTGLRHRKVRAHGRAGVRVPTMTTPRTDRARALLSRSRTMRTERVRALPFQSQPTMCTERAPALPFQSQPTTRTDSAPALPFQSQ